MTSVRHLAHVADAMIKAEFSVIAIVRCPCDR